MDNVQNCNSYTQPVFLHLACDTHEKLVVAWAVAAAECGRDAL
jgi:hypothetical protein